MNALRRKLKGRLLKLATLLGAFTVLWACNAPFIPVPPPGASFTSALVDDGAGGQKTVWVTHGLPSTNAAGAYFYIFNDPGRRHHGRGRRRHVRGSTDRRGRERSHPDRL